MWSRVLPSVVFAATLSVSLAAAALAQGRTYAPDPERSPAGRAMDLAPGRAVPGELIVRFEPATPGPRREAIRDAAGAEFDRSLLLPGLQLVTLDPSVSIAQARADLERRPEVRYAEPNLVGRYEAVPNDPMFGNQWGLHNTGQLIGLSTGTADADIDAPEAWDLTTGDPGVIVADGDSGFAIEHPDLAPNIWSNPGEAAGAPGVDDDGNGLVDDVRGWDFFGNTPVLTDYVGHGSRTAGAIGARGGNGLGISGTAHGVTLMPLKIGDLAPSTAAVAAGINYARVKGARVINLSLTVGNTQALRDAIIASPNLLLVVAAGNDGESVEVNPSFPCSYPYENVLCVAASTKTDQLASFSNTGAQSVDLAAPGQEIFMTRSDVFDVLSEGFESATLGDVPAGWSRTSGATWGATSATSSSGARSLADSPGANYANNASQGARTPQMNTQGKERCRVELDVRLDILTNDFLQVRRSTNGSSFTANAQVSGTTSGAFQTIPVSIGQLDNQATAFVDLFFASDASGVADGAYVDNFKFRCVDPAQRGTANVYAFGSGTSFASPITAGVAGLVLSRKPTLTATEVKSLITGNVDPLPAFAGNTVTGGRLNAFRAVSAAAPVPLPPPPPPPDTTRPVLSSLALNPVAFAPVLRGGFLSVRRGSKLRYSLSEAASVRLSVYRRLAGRRSGRRCVRPTRRNRHARRCTRLAFKGSLTRRRPAGSTRATFTARVRGRKLAVGPYRLVGLATDTAGNRSRSRERNFRIVPATVRRRK